MFWGCLSLFFCVCSNSAFPSLVTTTSTCKWACIAYWVSVWSGQPCFSSEWSQRPQDNICKWFPAYSWRSKFLCGDCCVTVPAGRAGTAQNWCWSRVFGEGWFIVSCCRYPNLDRFLCHSNLQRQTSKDKIMWSIKKQISKRTNSLMLTSLQFMPTGF